jgi:dGTPase
MLKWDKLLNPVRRKELEGSHESLKTGAGRMEIERDYDRILFAAPTRRLADKTQVFPMEENDSVRNRLTHSHEVSNLARSIGVRLAFENAESVFGPGHDSLEVKRNVPALLAAVGLAHDLGNPPFGHQGELAMQQWFSENAKCLTNPVDTDFIKFDGNAQTFRLLTKLQLLNDEFGLNLTVATLAGLLKYPSIYGSSNKGGFKKHGVFKSEEEVVKEIWNQTGLEEGVRHPLAFVMEACDDIAYSIIDAEDTVKKGYASFYDLMDYLDSYSQKMGKVSVRDKTIDTVVKVSRKKNEEFKQNSLSSRELNDISMQMFRVCSIKEMVLSATEAFVNNIDNMLDGSIGEGFELIENSESCSLCEATKEFDVIYGFKHRDVLRLELEGSNYIKSMMTMLWRAVNAGDNKALPFERYVFKDISENYRRIYESSPKNQYAKCQLICDVVSGMTEKFLIKKHNEYKSLENVVS